MKDIYTAALRVLPASDIDHDNIGTDLYLKVSEASVALVASYDFRGNVEKFRSPLDGCLWFDVPFAYTPAWLEKLQQRPRADVARDWSPVFDTLARRLEREAGV